MSTPTKLTKKEKEEHSLHIKNTLVDIFAMLTFSIIVGMTNEVLIVGILFFNEVEWREMVSACVTVTLLSIIVGRPFGIFLDFCRKLFGVQGEE